jgi:DNA/RNA-binding protein KIN17
MRQMALFAENKEHYINSHSQEFHSEFLGIIKRYKDKFMDSNVLYQEYSSSHDHMHLNATKWQTLTEYIEYLGKEGICRVDVRDNGLYIKYVEKEAETNLTKRIVAEKSEEERDRDLLNKQIERAFANKKNEKTVEKSELKRDGEIKLVMKPIKTLVKPKLSKNKILK